VGGTGAQSTAVDVYDPKNDTWSTVGAPMPTRRDHMGAAVVGGRLFVVAGDVGGHSRNTAVNEAFDPATGEWTNRTPIPKMRGSVSVASWMGRVVVLGGQNGPNGVPAFADADAYEPVTNAWTSLPAMPSGRHGFPSGVWQGKLYAFAGAPQMGVTGFDRVDVLASPS
ncbi:MAG TPA: kelch repeat-containing protein, partial [Candidatus Thermoplasmatota archaeon]|nr:kelch repeat-containing protein [Candidatus Thermoplasmatota archaeon]